MKNSKRKVFISLIFTILCLFIPVSANSINESKFKNERRYILQDGSQDIAALIAKIDEVDDLFDSNSFPYDDNYAGKFINRDNQLVVNYIDNYTKAQLSSINGIIVKR